MHMGRKLGKQTVCNREPPVLLPDLEIEVGRLLCRFTGLLSFHFVGLLHPNFLLLILWGERPPSLNFADQGGRPSAALLHVC